MCQGAVKCGIGMKAINYKVGGTISFHEPEVGTGKKMSDTRKWKRGSTRSSGSTENLNGNWLSVSMRLICVESLAHSSL